MQKEDSSEQWETGETEVTPVVGALEILKYGTDGGRVGFVFFSSLLTTAEVMFPFIDLHWH